MTDEQNRPDGRFKAEMPAIPGVGTPSGKSPAASGRLMMSMGAVAMLIAIIGGFKLVSKPRRADQPASTAQFDGSASASSSDLTAAVPAALDRGPGIARVGDLSKAWESAQFSFRDPTSGENVAGTLIRLPTGNTAQSNGYWSFALRAPFGNCQLEFVRDLEKLRADYGFRRATHPMVGNPCSRTVFDPLKYGAIPGNVLARGAVAQGSDLRPPLSIEIQIKGKDIFAVRME